MHARSLIRTIILDRGWRDRRLGNENEGFRLFNIDCHGVEVTKVRWRGS